MTSATSTAAASAYEQALIWGLLVDPTYVPEVLGRLRDDDFVDPTFRRIWQSIGRIAARGDSVTEHALELDLGAHGELGKVDRDKLIVGSPYPDPAAIGSYVDRVLEARRARAAHRLVHEAAARPMTDESLSELHARLGEVLADAAPEDDFASLADFLPGFVEDLDARRSGQRASELMRFGIDSLDQLTDGALPGELVVVAARPGDGKTAFAMTVANHVAESGGVVSFFSLEQPRDQLAARLLSAVASINGRRFRDPRALSDENMDAIRRAASTLVHRRILIRDSQSSMRDIVRACRRMVRRGMPPALVVIDYVELITTPKEERHRDRYDRELGERTKAAKSLAKELRCPVLMLAQLGREVEKAKRRPTKADLRNSGEIEQDADQIFMLHRLPDPTDPNEKGDTTEILVTKGRGTGEGVATVRFRAEFTRFEEIAERAMPGLVAPDRVGEQRGGREAAGFERSLAGSAGGWSDA